MQKNVPTKGLFENENKDKKRILVPVADGFEEIEFVTIVDVLRRAGFDVMVANAGNFSKRVKGYNGIAFGVDAMLEDCVNQYWDAIVIPGGDDNSKTLANNDQLIQMLKIQKTEGRWIGAICASPAIVLARNGFLDEDKATCIEKLKHDLPDQSKAHMRVVISHNIITSQAPGTAIEFCTAIIGVFCGREKAKKIAGELAGIMSDQCELMPPSKGVNPFTDKPCVPQPVEMKMWHTMDPEHKQVSAI